MQKDRFSPTLSCAEGVAVGESTTGSEANKGSERNPSRYDIGHMYVDRGEASHGGGKGHFGVPVNTLFAKDGYPRLAGERRRESGSSREDVFFRIKGELVR